MRRLKARLRKIVNCINDLGFSANILIRGPAASIESHSGWSGWVNPRGTWFRHNGRCADVYTDKDRDFFQKRYDEELTRAAGVKDETLRSLHSRWAELYRQRLAALLAQR